MVAASASPEEMADRYAAARARILGIVARLRPGDMDRPVPATPKWTVHALLSHLVGVAAAFDSGRLEGAPGEQWTDEHVTTRRQLPVLRLLEEWEQVAERLDAAIRGGAVPMPVVLDILTHESDLRAALGVDRTPDAGAVRFLLDGFGGRAAHVAAKAQLPSLQLRASDSDWQIGESGGITGSAPEAEWARALAGRRSAVQIGRYEWSADPSAYLDLLSPFGPLPATDVVEEAAGR